MARIVLSHVTKTYSHGAGAVKDVCLQIEDGEFLILVGPSGCGKTTTLNMIAGLESITSGELFIDDRKVNDVRPQDRDIAMVFQSYALYPHMSVRRNIAFPLTLRKMKKTDIQRKVMEVAEILDLTTVLDYKPSQLSGGQRQRVAMGRAIVRHPKAFLMDEPLSNLDAKLRIQMRAEIAKLQRQLGTTTIYVTHDQTEAMTLGDRVVVMDAGRVQQIGTPDEIYQRPVNLFVAGFMGSPRMNFFPAQLQNNEIDFGFASMPIPVIHQHALAKHKQGLELVCGIRPEHLTTHDHPHGVKIRVEVDLVESLGSDKYVYFTHIHNTSHQIDTTWVARISSNLSPVRGQNIDLTIDPERLIIFHAQTGINLTSDAS